jgi:hypothetical protein
MLEGIILFALHLLLKGIRHALERRPAHFRVCPRGTDPEAKLSSYGLPSQPALQRRDEPFSPYLNFIQSSLPSLSTQTLAKSVPSHME